MSNTREKGGVGLGLSICQKIIDAHDGKIWIESELDKGTTINLTLPRK
jgi:signal transduction histidine kinase